MNAATTLRGARSSADATDVPPPSGTAGLDAATDARRRSDAIRIARVVCITGVIYVHAWTGLSGHELELARGTGQETLRWVLMEVFGRSAVPLLGMISGWLVAGSSRTRRWTAFVSGKARSILLPMVLWNLLALLLVSGSAWLLSLPAPVPHSAAWTIDEIFVLTRSPDIDVQMPFLRDLFVCMVAAPLLLRAPASVLVLLPLLAAAAQVSGLGAPIILRPAIVVFFIAGILVRRHAVADKVAALPFALAIVPFIVLMPVQLHFSLAPTGSGQASLRAVADLFVRFAAAIAYWRIAWSLAASRARDRFLSLEPYAFFAFCCHLILLWLGGPLLGSVFGKMGSPLYPLYLLAQPVLVMGTAIALAHLLVRIFPRAAHVLSGGRLAS